MPFLQLVDASADSVAAVLQPLDEAPPLTLLTPRPSEEPPPAPVETIREIDRAQRRGSARLRWTLVGLDTAALLGSWLPFLLTPAARLTGARPTPALALTVAILSSTAACLVLSVAKRLYRARVANVKAKERAGLCWVAALSAVTGGVVLWRLGAEPSRATLLVDALVAFLLLASERSMYRWWLAIERYKGRYRRPTLIVGTGEEERYWTHHLAEHPELGVEVTGVLADEPPEARGPEDAPWLGSCSDAISVAARTGATSVLVMATAFEVPELRRTVRELTATGLHVQVSMGLLGLAQRRLTMTPVSRENVFYVEQRSLSPRSLLLKRALDLAVGSVALLLSLPLLGAVCLLVRLEDRGPAFFRQERVGRNGKTFTLYKLRTMTVGADRQRQQLAEHNLRTGPLFKVSADPRVTRIGKLLRLTSIDELPQLFNVLKGEMSLVGPRPALPEEVAEFDQELLARHDVPPGMTGLWQVEGREDASFESYHRLDLHYVENWSLGFDISLLLSTTASLLSRVFRAVTARRSGRQLAA